MARFAILPELGLNPLELGAELNSASNGDTFEGGCPSKNITLTPNTGFWGSFPRYFLARFAILPELGLNQLELGAELNSVSIGGTFKVVCPSKNMTLTPNTSFWGSSPRYISSRFAILSELGLNRLELGAELNSASNAGTFEGGCPSKNITLTPNTGFWGSSPRYFLARFAILPELGLNRLELGAELNSASNGDTFEGGCPLKNGSLPQNTDFFRFLGKVFGVGIRYFS